VPPQQWLRIHIRHLTLACHRLDAILPLCRQPCRSASGSTTRGSSGRWMMLSPLTAPSTVLWTSTIPKTTGSGQPSPTRRLLRSCTFSSSIAEDIVLCHVACLMLSLVLDRRLNVLPPGPTRIHFSTTLRCTTSVATPSYRRVSTLDQHHPQTRSSR